MSWGPPQLEVAYAGTIVEDGTAAGCRSPGFAGTVENHAESGGDRFIHAGGDVAGEEATGVTQFPDELDRTEEVPPGSPPGVPHHEVEGFVVTTGRP